MWLFLGGAQAAQHWGEDSRLMRHGPMDWTVGTNWTVGNDSRRLGPIGDSGDYWERRRPGGICASCIHYQWLTGYENSCSSARNRAQNAGLLLWYAVSPAGGGISG